MDKYDNLSAAIQLFPREDGTISIWDHPNFKSRVTLPDDYFALTRVEQALELMYQGRLTEDMLTVLKVTGDAVCANENQLRRYMSRKLSASKTSEYLKKLRKHGFVQRHLCRLAFIEEEGEETIKPPAPFTLGIAGYKLLRHLYPEFYFVSPDYWIQQPMAIQRYVSVNEFRCQLTTLRILRKWNWNPLIGGIQKLPRPIAAAQLDTPQGDIQFIVERLQMYQDFLGYLRDKLNLLRYLYQRDGCFPLDGFEKDAYQIVCLHMSSKSMADFVQGSLKLHTYPFDVWMLIDEWITQEHGLSKAFCIPKKEDGHLTRIRVPFLDNQQITREPTV